MSFQPMSEILCNVKSRPAAEAGKQDRSGLGVIAKEQVDCVARLPGSGGSAGGTARGWRWPQHAAMVRNAPSHVQIFHHYRHFQHLVKACIPVKFLRTFQEVWYFQRMLKDHHLMKEAEARAGEALRRLLENIPILQIEGIEAERCV